MGPRFKVANPPSLAAPTHGGQSIKISPSEPRAEVRPRPWKESSEKKEEKNQPQPHAYSFKIIRSGYKHGNITKRKYCQENMSREFVIQNITVFLFML